MGYQLGVDLGTTYTAAALCRDGHLEVVGLGNHGASVPSVILLREDEGVLTGEAALRRGLLEPARVARQFKRRLGDPTPLLLGGTPYSADALMSKLLRWVVDKVTEEQGAPPDHVAVSHPANWGPYKTDLLTQAVRQADLDRATMLSEPEAAAISYAANERVEPGSVIAVYDLGGGTFDAAVLVKTEDGFEMRGDPEGIERLGGIDLDEAVLSHVRRSLDGKLEEMDPEDERTLAAMVRLREECVAAKEALSADTEVSIPVLLPVLQTEVRLTRSEFEAMIRPTLAETVAALQRALRSADVSPEQVHTVLLVGGSSRIPLIAQLVSAELERPVAVDAHPKHAIALGAALTASAATGGSASQPGPLEDRTEVHPTRPVPVVLPAQPDRPLDPVRTASSGTAEPGTAEPGTAESGTAEPGAVEPRTPDADRPVSTPGSPAGETMFADASADDTGPADAARRVPVLAAAMIGVLALAGGAYALTISGQGADDDERLSASTEVDPAPGSEVDPGAGVDEPSRGAQAGSSGEGAPDPPDHGADPGPATGSDRQEPSSSDGSDGGAEAPATTDPGAGDEEPSGAEAEESPPGEETAPEDDPPPEEDEDPGPSEPVAALSTAITEIALDEGVYVVSFTTDGFTASLPDPHHVHFFFDTVTPLQAGRPGSGPWELYGGPSPFTGYTVEDRPDAATQLCVLVAEPDHSVRPDTGNCRDLP